MHSHVKPCACAFLFIAIGHTMPAMAGPTTTLTQAWTFTNKSGLSEAVPTGIQLVWTAFGPGAAPDTGTALADETGRITALTMIDTTGNTVTWDIDLLMHVEGVAFIGHAAGNSLAPFVESPPNFNTVEGAVTLGDRSTTGVNSKAASMLADLVFIHDYFKNAFTVDAAEVLVQHDPGIPFAYTSATPQFDAKITVPDDRWANSDGLLHEYGHHLMVTARSSTLPDPASMPHEHMPGIDNIKGGNSGSTTIPARSVIDGSRLSYNEAGATMLAIMAKHAGNYASARPNMPASDYDLFLDHVSSTAATVGDANITSGFSVETTSVRVLSEGSLVTTDRGGVGEADELSVVRAMWDFYDADNETAFNPNAPLRKRPGDRVTMGATRFWDAMDGADTFDKFWKSIAASTADPDFRSDVFGGGTYPNRNTAMALLGEILEEQNISSNLVRDRVVTDDTSPEIRWFPQNNGHSKYERVLIFPDGFGEPVYDSMALADLTGATHAHELTVDLPVGSYWIVVLNSPVMLSTEDMLEALNADRYLWYWSGASILTIQEEIPAPGVAALFGIGGCVAAARRRRQR